MAAPVLYRVPRSILAETFRYFRSCGRGRRECQVVWISPWASSDVIAGVRHPKHKAHMGGFDVDGQWLTELWNELAATSAGIRVQIHTHPRQAFHSHIDDAYPIIHSIGFLSLVIPNFAAGPVGFEGAYLTEIQPSGGWREASIPDRLRLTDG